MHYYILLNQENIIQGMQQSTNEVISNQLIEIDVETYTKNILGKKWDIINNKIDETYTPPVPNTTQQAILPTKTTEEKVTDLENEVQQLNRTIVTQNTMLTEILDLLKGGGQVE